MPDELDPAATAVLPVEGPDAGSTGPGACRDAPGLWRARAVLFDVAVQRIAGPPARTRFPIVTGRLELAGRSTMVGLQLQAREPHRPSPTHRALLGRVVPADGTPGLRLHCTAATGRRLAGELLIGGLARAVSLRIKLLDAQPNRVLIWLTGQAWVPARERHLGHAHPRLLIAAEFTR